MSHASPASVAPARTQNGSILNKLVPSPIALFTIAGCAIILALAKAIGTVISDVGDLAGLYVAGGVAILGLPAVVAWRRRALRMLGAEMLPPFAFYLAMLHAPMQRLVVRGGRDLGSAEVRVLEMALYASLGVSCVVCLRPGAFDRSRALLRPVPDITGQAARFEAFAGIVAALLGYALLFSWIGSVGVTTIADADLGDVYLAAGETTFTFMWPLLVGGIIAIARAFGRWPDPGPTLVFRAIYLMLIAGYVTASWRLGMRGPVLELMVAIYLVRGTTARPVKRRVALIGLAIFAAGFVFVSAMRTHLGAGFTGTSLREVQEKTEETALGQTNSEFDVLFENSVMISQLAGFKTPFLDGQSYADVPLQLVPRQLLRDNKPLQLSAWWIAFVDPEAARRGSGRCFGSFAEGYLNYALPGAVGQVALVTLLLLALLPVLRANAVGLSTMAAVVLAHGYHCHRIELVAALFFARNALIVAAVTMAVLWLVKAMFNPIAQRGLPVTTAGPRSP